MSNTDSQLIERLKKAVREENHHLARTLHLLCEVSERQLHLAQGYSSLYKFCIKELCLSEGSVYRRTQVVAKIRKFPMLLKMIEDSDLNLTVAALLCPHLDRQTNVKSFLLKFKGKTKRAAEDLLVDKMAPRATPRDDIRRVPDRLVLGARSQNLDVSGVGNGSPKLVETSPGHPAASPKEVIRNPEVVREKCYQINFAASERFKQKLEKLKGLLAHKYPAGRLEHIIEEAMDHLITAKTPKAKRETSPKPSRSRNIPVKWEEQAFVRAGHRCQFVGVNGRRCGSAWLLQIDHAKPLSLGGVTELSNLQVLCAAHNLHKAKCDHGAEYVQRKIGNALRRGRVVVGDSV